MIWLNKKNILFLHDEIISNFGGLNGLRDETRLDSLIELPFLTFEGKELYPSKLEKIVRLSYSLTINHSFIDGNKRIGAISLIFLLEHNNFNIEFSNEELIKLFIDIASDKLCYEDLLSYLKNKINNN